MKTAEQAVHDILWKKLSEMIGDSIYESRPMTEVGYPFADFEDFETSYTGTKLGNTSRVSANLNIWDTEGRRKNVSDVCANLFHEAITMREAYGHKISLQINESGIRIIQDRTVTPPVWRGIVTLVFDIL